MMTSNKPNTIKSLIFLATTIISFNSQADNKPSALSTVTSFVNNQNILAIKSASNAHGMNITTLESVNDVPSAVAELTSALELQGFEIVLIIDHAAAAASVNLDLNPNQVIFARPAAKLESSLLQKSHTIGIELPLKFHVFEDHQKIKLSVNSLGYQIDRHQLKTNDGTLKNTANFTQQFSKSSHKKQGLITVESMQSLSDSVLALQNAITTNPDARIPLVLNYSERSNNSVPATLIVFGNPNVGTPLMQTDPRIGIDLPLKLLVWENQQSQVYITYNNPHFIASRIRLEGHDEQLDSIADALKNIANAGATP